MPTGYTSEIANGQSSKDFMKECMRAFGALVHLRDDPRSEIPSEVKPSNYHFKAIEIAKQQIKEFSQLNEEQLRQKFDDWKKTEIEKTKKYINEKNDLKHKYNKVLNDVADWNPPTSDHIKYKEFMVSQLLDSIDYDCDDNYSNKELSILFSKTFEEWKGEKERSLSRDLSYHGDEWKEEVMRCNEKTEWIQTLLKSINNYTEKLGETNDE